MLEGKYNPLWHEVDFTGYNTLTSGIYNDVSPLGYQSIKDLTDKYVNNLKDSYLGRSNGFIHTGVTGDQIKKYWMKIKVVYYLLLRLKCICKCT